MKIEDTAEICNQATIESNSFNKFDRPILSRAQAEGKRMAMLLQLYRDFFGGYIGKINSQSQFC